MTMEPSCCSQSALRPTAISVPMRGKTFLRNLSRWWCVLRYYRKRQTRVGYSASTLRDDESSTMHPARPVLAAQTTQVSRHCWASRHWGWTSGRRKLQWSQWARHGIACRIAESMTRLSTTVSIEFPREVLHAARMTVDELKRELAVHLFDQGRLSFGKAREMAGMTVTAFQQLLGSRGVYVHYDLAEYQEDLATLQELRRP